LDKLIGGQHAPPGISCVSGPHLASAAPPRDYCEKRTTAGHRPPFFSKLPPGHPLARAAGFCELCEIYEADFCRLPAIDSAGATATTTSQAVRGRSRAFR